MEQPLKMCIIDDIRSVVDMISTRIPWHTHGIEVSGTAMDGEKGLELILAVRPDIIVTDIRMPKMDGLAMTRRILEELPHCKIVILSAYTDFDYVRQALQYGAVDYVTKPFSVEEMVRVVLKAKEACLADGRERERLAQMEAKIKESLPALRQEYLSLLVHHPTQEAALNEWWAFLQLKPMRPPWVIMVIQIDQLENRYAAASVKELELIRFSLQNIVEETLSARSEAVVFREAFNRYVCLVRSDGVDPNGDLPLAAADECCANIARHTKFTISIGIGQEARDVQELPRSYQQALRALSYHFYTGGNGAFLYRDGPENREPVWIHTTDHEGEFLFAFRSGNQEKCRDWLNVMFQAMEQSEARPDPGDVEHVAQGLGHRMLRILLERFAREDVKPFEARQREAGASGFPTLQSYWTWLDDLCGIGCRLIDSGRTTESRNIIYRSMEYIRSNLNQDLSLEHCARQVNLSWGYYSNLFKKVAGTPFQQYVTQAKMEKAKTMLVGPYQVQEIAQELGYEHRRYFSDVFKKYTGLTPTEYKESFTGKPVQP